MIFNKKFGYFYVALFLVTLFIPLLGIILGVTSNGSTEWRTLAKLPKLDLNTRLSDYPKEFDSFWNDNFGFRNWMIKQYAYIKLNILHSSPVATDIIGKNNWIFHNPITVNDFTKFYSHIQFSQAELDIIKKKFINERDWLKQRNIDYIITIVPDKEEIYAQYYPYPNHLIFGIRLNQLLSYLKKTDLKVIFLKDALIKGKDIYGLPLYFQTDTHWNNLGAFIGYQEIMRTFKQNHPNIHLLDKDYFDISVTDFSGNDIGDLLRLNQSNSKIQDFKVNLNLKENMLKNINKLHQIYVYGDSYAENKNGSIPEGLNYFFAYSFDKVEIYNFAWQLNRDEIEKSQPELVIRESVERNIYEWVNFAKI
jgi:alginate O-acetyltransferase complex protein AlgJ